MYNFYFNSSIYSEYVKTNSVYSREMLFAVVVSEKNAQVYTFLSDFEFKWVYQIGITDV